MKAKLIKHGHTYALNLNDKLVAFAHPEYLSENDTIGKLCLDNCQAIERGYDLDELASGYSEGKSTAEVFKLAHEADFKAGFQKALELMSDKKFSEEDIHEAYYLGGREDRSGFHDLLHLKQQTEWDVEIEMEKVEPYKDNMGNVRTEKTFPKLDADGCLILKIKSE